MAWQSEQMFLFGRFSLSRRQMKCLVIAYARVKGNHEDQASPEIDPFAKARGVDLSAQKESSLRKVARWGCVRARRCASVLFFLCFLCKV